ncbi:MAG: DNA-3-methyladenine glycosylase I [Anaerolineales bacterium]|nr:DNA-3-methyladenine glycosylase I [Anaerolineales bacterium]
MNITGRCQWCGTDPLYVEYHDTEWGVPIYDDQLLFAKLILDGAQAGLSWITILRKREAYWEAFDQFDPEKMARYDAVKLAELMQNPGIVRNKLKIEAAVTNARGYLDIMDKEGSFSRFLWEFVDGQPIQNEWQTLGEVPAETAVSRAMSKALKKRGFNFVGPTICYAFMQAVGMCNDHLVSCFRHEPCRHLAHPQSFLPFPSQ